MTEPIRVLQVVASLNAGGMENYIMNLYRMVDKSKVQFDFVVHHAAVGLYEDEIQELGGKIYHFTVLDDKNVVKYISELNRFFDEHKEYQIIHGHLSSLAVFYLGVAKKYNVPWRIAHSHGAGFLHTLKGTAKYLLFRTAKWNANVRLACSTEAGKYLYGKDTFEFVPNGKCLVSVTSMLLVMLEDLIYRKIMSIFCEFLKKFSNRHRISSYYFWEKESCFQRFKI